MTSPQERSKKESRKAVVSYCKQLLGLEFNGETSNHYGAEVTDQSNSKQTYHLGLYLKLIDQCIRQHNSPDHGGFRGDEEDFIFLLKLIALERRSESETSIECFKRLRNDKNRFVQFYQQRGVTSLKLQTTDYWGTRQQLRAAKVIADWIDPFYGPMDPIFGVLLCPTAGRTGPGDSYWMHNFLFDQSGPIAYHSAVHDAFGYLRNNHTIGPGYNYLSTCSIFKTENSLAGHMTGISFWSDILCKI